MSNKIEILEKMSDEIIDLISKYLENNRDEIDYLDIIGELAKIHSFFISLSTVSFIADMKHENDESKLKEFNAYR